MLATKLLDLDLGPRSYQIVIGVGLLDRLGAEIAPLLTNPRLAIVTNTTVAPLYLERVTASLAAAGLQAVPIILPDGESYKEWQTLQTIFDALIAQQLERNSALLALGGGVIGDITGFAAASFLRGVPYIQVPTTLLAQVDSSVGGKTGINHPLGKNLIGAFYQPKRVVMDLASLTTLPKRQLLAGMAEVIKYGIIRDAELFAVLEKKMEILLSLAPEPLAEVIYACCANKAQVVAEDEREGGVRALLNLGHTFGHAVETLTEYRMLHGEAVAVGMVLAADLSRRLGLTDEATVTRIRQLIRRTGLPDTAPDFPAESYLEVMARDKKVSAGKVRFVLVEGIGKARHGVAVEEEAIRETLKACCG